MKITTIWTKKIIPFKDSSFDLFDKYLTAFPERSILAVTSKIVSICEGRVVKIDEKINKVDLIKKEAEYYLPPEESKYNIVLTIKRNLLVPTAGIDESNGAGYYILWPKDLQKTANEIKGYLIKRFGLKTVGVIITDSRTTPLRLGTTGFAIAHSGFFALNSYIEKPDIFGRKLKVTKANVMDALGAAAVLAMGEGNEQTPLAIIEDLPFVKFQNRNPTKKELSEIKIDIDDDLYGPFLKSVKWRKGGGD